MRVVSWYDVEPPQLDGSRWVNERHIVAGERQEYRWLCRRRIDPQSEVSRRSREFATKENP